MTLWREPLVHFLLLGAALFAASGLVRPRTDNERETIVVTPGQIAHLAAGFTRVQRRPPSPDELEGLIRDHVRGEVYAREARALGLDRDDAVITQRLRQKMEFVSDDVAALTDPTEAQLEAYLEEHAGAFRVEPRFTFRQVYLDPQRRGDGLARDAERLLAHLRRAGTRADIATLGDAFLLDGEFGDVPSSEVVALFGERFAAALETLPPGQWQGPIASGFGAHLVFVGARTEGRVPTLAEVRDAVRREWANNQRQEAAERFYAGLLTRYAVTIERPAPASGEDAVAVR